LQLTVSNLEDFNEQMRLKIKLSIILLFASNVLQAQWWNPFQWWQPWDKKIYNKYNEAVVVVDTDKSSGSGFIIDNSGLVVTCYHVVQGAKKVGVETSSNQYIDVEGYTYVDEKRDFAILKLDYYSKNFTAVSLGDSEEMGVLDEVLSISNPLDLRNTVTKGQINGIREENGVKYFQITSSISPGSSGGPLFNDLGEVIGINRGTFGGNETYKAIHINYVKDVLSESKEIKHKVGFDYSLTKDVVIQKETRYVSTYNPKAQKLRDLILFLLIINAFFGS
tara:strand:+ start:700 stop:1536 length:837 start_codon:yes stop_codon:yes gene_type:complete